MYARRQAQGRRDMRDQTPDRPDLRKCTINKRVNGSISYGKRRGRLAEVWSVRQTARVTRPQGARGLHSGREFDPEKAGGPIVSLNILRIRIKPGGVAVVERHLARFGADTMNQVMAERPRAIAAGNLDATAVDLNFYAHELREYVRYRRLGHPAGAGLDRDLWNNAHSATLEDYGLDSREERLYHPDAIEAGREEEW